jgi:Tol biopolymer transport system component
VIEESITARARMLIAPPRGFAFCAVLVVGLLLTSACNQELGQPTVTSWAPIGISSAEFESHAAFDPRNGDIYFVRSTPNFEGWYIVYSKCVSSGWSTPSLPPFAGDGVEADPWFTPDGRSLLFISTRTSDGVRKSDLDIWQVDRDLTGAWLEPRRLPEPVNSPGQEWFPRIGPDGWLYFGSNRSGGIGSTDIWRASREPSGRWSVENLGEPVNTSRNEYEAQISPDETKLIVMADDGLYEFRRSGNQWAQRRRLPSPINLDADEVGPLFSPSGRTLLYSRDSKGDKSGEFVRWHIESQESWPDDCVSQP